MRTWRTRLIHWKLSSSEASGLCSATTTILSSCSTDTENTAILGSKATPSQTGCPAQQEVQTFIISMPLPPLPSPVHKLHGLHGQRCGNYVISVMSPPTDDHQSIHLSHNKHKAVLERVTKVHVVIRTTHELLVQRNLNASKGLQTSYKLSSNSSSRSCHVLKGKTIML